LSAGSSSSRGVPLVAMSNTTTLENHTGSWKYIRPVYQDKVAPCNERCPVGIDIESYMNFLREGKKQEACAVLLQDNPMPAITGRVCDYPCELACNRRYFDEAVAIHSVERELGDAILREMNPNALPRTRTERIAVVGSGPAGLACAYHLTRMGYGVEVFEATSDLGGMLRLGIPEFRLPRKVLDRQIDWLRQLGVEFHTDACVGDSVGWTEIADFDAVFVATGAHRARGMGIGEDQLEGFRSGLEFLKEVNGGARPDMSGNVVVVGGGNTAIDCARTALRLGAQPLVLYRRTRKEMPAIEQEVEEAEREGVRFMFLAAPVAAQSGDAGLESIECVRMRLGPPDESGRRRPVPVDDDRFTLPADIVLTAIGEIADLDFLPEDMEVRGSIVPVDELGNTGHAPVFAGGDIVDQPHSVAHALGSGKRAAVGIDCYLRRGAGEAVGSVDLQALRFAGGNLAMARWHDADPVSRAAPVNRVVDFEELNLNHFRSVPRHPDRELVVTECVAGFAEANLGMAGEVALAEAERCFNCGVCNECDLCLLFCPDIAITHGLNGNRYLIDMDYCKGCGICAAECPRGAMAMTRVGL